MFTYQLVSRGATAVLFFRWRQPRFGTEKFHGAVLPHNARANSRIFKEVAQLGDEMKLLAPSIKVKSWPHSLMPIQPLLF